MVGTPDRQRLLTAARADLLEGGRLDLPGVPDHVAASWRRSISRGVTPHEVASEYHTELDLGSRLARCAQPVIDELSAQVADIPVCVALTDKRARLLSRTDSGPGIARILDRVSFAQGFGYAEDAVGTNGVGTVLEFGESVHIVGAEHFVETLQSFACAGAPVRDPFTGRIEGVLDISCLSEDSTPILHSLVRAAARRIENALLTDRTRRQQALFDAYSRADARSRQAVLAVGQRVVLANATMQALLDPGDQEALRDHLQFVVLRHSSVDDRVDLPSGACVRLRGSAVGTGDDVAGMVGVVSVLPEAGGYVDIPAPRRGHPGPRAPGNLSPAWRAAAATTRAALGDGESVLVLGEPGTGRFTLLAGAHALVQPGGRVVGLGVGEIEADPQGVAGRLRGPATARVLHVLRDIDRLRPATVDVLLRALQRAGTPPVAATASGTGAGPGGKIGAHRPLLALFRASASVPPLRLRTGDLPVLAGALLAELAPQREVRLSPTASRLLASYRWPGNVRELRDALAAALVRRPVGLIEAADLPSSCQSTPRTSLRPVDEIERDAIVAALRDAGGNRVVAAAALGIARSTLYRKIRAYGITL